MLNDEMGGENWAEGGKSVLSEMENSMGSLGFTEKVTLEKKYEELSG